jgi:MFS family permease
MLCPPSAGEVVTDPFDQNSWGMLLKYGHSSTRSSLHLITLAWVFGAAWMYITTGAVLTRFAQWLEMPAFGFGVLAALPFAGALFQLPVSYLVERHGGRKRTFLIAGIAHRALWFAIAFIPWWVSGGGGWVALLWVFGLSSVVANVAAPTVLAWLADIVPGRIRGRYFSRRLQIGQFVGLIATLVIGFALDQADQLGETTLIKTLVFALSVSATCGMLDFILLSVIKDPPAHQPNPNLTIKELIRGPLADSNFRRFLGFTATLTFAIGFIGQFVWLYVFDVVGMSNVQANLMLVAFPLAAQMLTFPIWGKLTDRLGRRPVLIIAGILVVNGASAWVFVTPDHWWLGYTAVLLTAASWPGVEICNLNLLLGMSQSKQNGGGGSAYIAINSVVIAVAGVASGLFGGVVAELMETWQGSLFGWPLTYHGVLFLVSAALRIVAVAWAISLTEPGAVGTRAAIRYITSHVYSNMQQAIFMPTRRLGPLRVFTFNLLPWVRRFWAWPTAFASVLITSCG